MGFPLVLMERHRSIVRDGNHFIYLGGSGWVLIDGPWFKAFEASGHRNVLTIPIPPKTNWSLVESDYVPTNFEMETFQWERGYWHPGGRNPFNTNSYLWVRWQEVLGNRTKPGWRVKPDGRLPLTFCSLTLEQALRTEYWLEPPA